MFFGIAGNLGNSSRRWNMQPELLLYLPSVVYIKENVAQKMVASRLVLEQQAAAWRVFCLWFVK